MRGRKEPKIDSEVLFSYYLWSTKSFFQEGTRSWHTRENHTEKLQWNLNFHPLGSYGSLLLPKSGTLGNSEAGFELWSHFFSSSPQHLASLP